jgi:hypothetical protein
LRGGDPVLFEVAEWFGVQLFFKSMPSYHHLSLLKILSHEVDV